MALFLVAMLQIASATEVSWVRDYPAALAKAKSSDRLMMVFIYSDWCPYCKQLNAVTYPDPLVIAKSRQVVPFRINADKKENKPLIKKFGLLGFPTILFIDKNEQIQGKIPGYEGPESYAADIDRFIASYKASPAMKARLAKNPSDSEANIWMAAIKAWLEARGYVHVLPGEGTRFNAMPPGSFSFRMNVPVKLEGGIKTINIPIDAAIMPKNAKIGSLPIFLEAKSAGDFTNTNKRRKEEAVKMAQLRNNYGKRVRFNLFLCGYFDSGYLGYEAAEGIDWVWEHRIDDLVLFVL